MSKDIHLLLHNPKVQSRVLRKRAVVNDFNKSPRSITGFAEERGISRDSLSKYVREAKIGVEALIDGRHFNTGRPSSVRRHHLQWLIAYQTRSPKAPLTVATVELNKVAIEQGWETVDYYSVYRAIKALPSDELAIIRGESEAFYQEHFPVGKRVIETPLAQWQIDATTFDIWALNMETGEVFQPTILGTIDCASRVVPYVKVLSATPNAVDLLSYIRTSVMPKKDFRCPFYGIPGSINFDNAQIHRDDSVKATLLKCGIEFTYSPVGCSGVNGKIERFFGTFLSGLAKRLYNYSGREAALKRAEVAGAIPFPLLQGIVDRYVQEYNTTTHSALEKSPWEAWHEGLNQANGLIFDQAAISEAFHYPVSVTVDRGSFSLQGNRYKAAELAALTGKSVTVFRDPDTLTKRLKVFYQGKAFCIAVRDDGDLADDLNAARNARRGQAQAKRSASKKVIAAFPPNGAEPLVVPPPKTTAARNKPTESVLDPIPDLPIED